MNLRTWNNLSVSELAMLFEIGLWPSEIPVGFAHRRQRIAAAMMLVERKLAERKLAEQKPTGIAATVAVARIAEQVRAKRQSQELSDLAIAAARERYRTMHRQQQEKARQRYLARRQKLVA